MDTVVIWKVSAYVSSELPLTSKVCSVMSIQLVIISPDAPSKELIEALVGTHTQNCTLLLSEVERDEVSAKFFSDN